MGMFNENPAGQPCKATWYEQVISEDGQIKNYNQEGEEFFCTVVQPERTSRTFRTNIESKSVNLILGSTNISKLVGIEEGARVVFRNKRYDVAYADFDESKGRYLVALT